MSDNGDIEPLLNDDEALITTQDVLGYVVRGTEVQSNIIRAVDPNISVSSQFKRLSQYQHELIRQYEIRIAWCYLLNLVCSVVLVSVGVIRTEVSWNDTLMTYDDSKLRKLGAGIGITFVLISLICWFFEQKYKKKIFETENVLAFEHWWHYLIHIGYCQIINVVVRLVLAFWWHFPWSRLSSGWVLYLCFVKLGFAFRDVIIYTSDLYSEKVFLQQLFRVFAIPMPKVNNLLILKAFVHDGIGGILIAFIIPIIVIVLVHGYIFFVVERPYQTTLTVSESFYWAFGTVMRIGYGDTVPSPSSVFSIVFTCLTTVFGLFLFSCLVAVIINQIQLTNTERKVAVYTRYLSESQRKQKVLSRVILRFLRYAKAQDDAADYEGNTNKHKSEEKIQAMRDKLEDTLSKYEKLAQNNQNEQLNDIPRELRQISRDFELRLEFVRQRIDQNTTRLNEFCEQL